MRTIPVGAAIVGTGNIAGPYAKNILGYPHVALRGVADLDIERAREFAAAHAIPAYDSLAALLADPSVELVVNLTTHHAHKAVTEQCLLAGKHVHSEKPLALTYAEARELVALAETRGLRLGCSPFTWMGEAQQTAWKVLREGRLGAVRLAYAEVNWGRIESWHPAPGPFYQVGALFDVGVYPLTLLTAIFGPARRVLGYGALLYPDRVTKHGEPFQIETPDFVTAVVELASGTVVRLTTNFYVGHHNKQKGIELHGDLGSLHLASWQNFDAAVEFAEFGKEYVPVAYVKQPYKGTEWGRAVADMADAIINERPHRATGEQAAHIVEILCAIDESIRRGAPVAVESSFAQPEPLEWAEAG
jgi:predicted dehydrogenase